MVDAAIEMVSVSKTFGKRAAVRNVTLTANPGEVVGFVGLNGAGKTTTIRLLLGLLSLSGGAIRLLGQPPNRGTRREVGALVDHPGLYGHLTAVDNLRIFALIRGIPRDQLDEAVARGLSDFGLIASRNKSVASLSTGMKQRLALALAFAGEPRVIILDEPTEGLDPEGLAALREVIRREAASGSCVFFSSHLLSEVEAISKRVVMIHAGDVIADEPVDASRSRSTISVAFRDSAVATAAFEHLIEHGYRCSRGGALETAFVVESPDGDEIVKLLCANGMFATEVRGVRDSLEARFLARAGLSEPRAAAQP